MRRLMGLLVALALATAVAAAPASVAGYQLMGFFHTDTNISYCFTSDGEGYIGADFKRNTIGKGFERWNQENPNLNIYEDCGVFGAFYDVKVHLVTPASLSGSLASGGCNTFSGYATNYSGESMLVPQSGGCAVKISTFAIDTTWTYWGGAPDSECGMGPSPGNCRFDGKTIAMHEMGHVLGLDHTGAPDCAWAHDGIRYHQDEHFQACEYSGEKAMNPWAGTEGYIWGSWQGYRHQYVTTDDRDGLNHLYGPI